MNLWKASERVQVVLLTVLSLVAIQPVLLRVRYAKGDNPSLSNLQDELFINITLSMKVDVQDTPMLKVELMVLVIVQVGEKLNNIGY